MRTLTVVALLVLAMASVAYADLENAASCHVYVNVDPNIGIMPVAPYFDLGSVQTGLFTGIIPFQVDANTEQVRLAAAASHLYKGNVYVPGIPLEVQPVMLNMTSVDDLLPGITITAHAGSPIGGASNHALYTQQTQVEGYPGWMTGSIVFESAQNNHFSQLVDLGVTWDQSDPEKPMGEYSGAVALYAWVVLPTP
jgi:hypothetical protein